MKNINEIKPIQGIDPEVQSEMIKRLLNIANDKDLRKNDLSDVKEAERILRLLFGSKSSTIEGRKLREAFEIVIQEDGSEIKGSEMQKKGLNFFRKRKTSSLLDKAIGVVQNDNNLKNDLASYEDWKKQLVAKKKDIGFSAGNNSLISGLTIQSTGMILDRLSEKYTPEEMLNILNFTDMKSPVWKDFKSSIGAVGLLKTMNTTVLTSILRQSMFRDQGVARDPDNPERVSYFYKQMFPFGIYKMNIPPEEQKISEDTMFTDSFMNVLGAYLHTIYRTSRNKSMIPDAKMVLNIQKAVENGQDKYFQVKIPITGSMIKDVVRDMEMNDSSRLKEIVQRGRASSDAGSFMSSSTLSSLRSYLSTAFSSWRSSRLSSIDERGDSSFLPDLTSTDDDEFDSWDDITISSMSIFRNMDEEDENDVLDFINGFDEEPEIEGLENAVGLFEEFDDGQLDIDYGINDDDFDNMAFCRGEFLLKKFGPSRSQRPIFSSYTDCGICIYECLFFIKNYAFYSDEKNKKTRGDIVKSEIVRSFLNEEETLRDYVFCGNPVKVWKWNKQKKMVEDFNLLFWEMPEINDYWDDDIRFTIVIRACHASLYHTSLLKEHRSRMNYGGKLDKKFFTFKLKKLKSETEIAKSREKLAENTQKKKNSKDKKQDGFRQSTLFNFGESQCVVRKKSRNDDDDDDDEESLGNFICPESCELTEEGWLNMQEKLDIEHEKMILKDKKLKKNSVIGDPNKKVKVAFKERCFDGLKFVETQLDKIKANVKPPQKGPAVFSTGSEIQTIRKFDGIFNVERFEQNVNRELFVNMDYRVFPFTRSPDDSEMIEFAFDFETVQVNGVFYIYNWCVVNIHNFNERVWCWGVEDCRMEFIKFVEFFIDGNFGYMLGARKPKYKVKFWSFNGGKFDCMFFVSYFLQFHNTKIVGDPKNIKLMRISNVCFHDLILILPGSLEDVGKAYGDKRFLKKGLDHRSITMENYHSKKEEILKYCFFDVFCLGACVLNFFKFCKEFDVDRYPFSSSHLAMNIFRTKYFDEEAYPIEGLPEDIYPIVKASYFGGMCVAFRKEFIANDMDGIKLKGYDINSSYPYALKSAKVPYRFNDRLTTEFCVTKENYKERLIATDLYAIKGFKFKKDVLYPFLSVRDEDGLLWCPLEYEELYYAWGNVLIFGFENDVWENDKICVAQTLRFTADYCFSGFITDLFERRKKAKVEENEPLSEFLKRMMNSLYGKFGQKKLPRKDYLTFEQAKYAMSINNKAFLYSQCKKMKADKYIREQIKKKVNIPDMVNFYDEDPNLFEIVYNLKTSAGIGTCVHIASFITSEARKNLLKGIFAVTNKGRELNVYYCDTDSIYGVFEGKNAMPKDMIGDELGQWKHECDIRYGMFLAPKMYAYVKDGVMDLKKWKNPDKFSTVQYNDKQKEDMMRMVMKCKGVRKSFLKPEFFNEILYKNTAVVNAGDMFKRVHDGVTVRAMIKKIKHAPRRQWLIDGRSYPALGIGKWMKHELSEDPSVQFEQVEILENLDLYLEKNPDLVFLKEIESEISSVAYEEFDIDDDF